MLLRFQAYATLRLDIECERVEILVKMGVFGSAGDRHYPRGFVQQPSECYLRGGHASLPAKLLEFVNYPGIGAYCLRLETRQSMTVVVIGIKTGVFIYAASEKTTVERTVWHKSYSELTKWI